MLRYVRSDRIRDVCVAMNAVAMPVLLPHPPVKVSNIKDHTKKNNQFGSEASKKFTQRERQIDRWRKI